MWRQVKEDGNWRINADLCSMFKLIFRVLTYTWNCARNWRYKDGGVSCLSVLEQKTKQYYIRWYLLLYMKGLTNSMEPLGKSPSNLNSLPTRKFPLSIIAKFLYLLSHFLTFKSQFTPCCHLPPTPSKLLLRWKFQDNLQVFICFLLEGFDTLSHFFLSKYFFKISKTTHFLPPYCSVIRTHFFLLLTFYILGP